MEINISEDQAKVLDILKDYSKYAPTFLKVQTLDNKLVPYKFNMVQVLLHAIMADIKKQNRLLRLVILKARRMGISTDTSGRHYWKVSTGKNRYSLCITHEPDASDFLFKIIKRFYDNSPEGLRPAIRYNNARLLEFNTADGKGLDSAMRVGTAGKSDYGSGQLIHYAHFSEVAKWPAATQRDVLTSVLQCVPNTPDTEVVFESTARGVGGEFYDRYFGARYIYTCTLDQKGRVVITMTINEQAPPENDYSAIFFPWFIFPEYTMAAPADMVLTDEEEILLQRHNLTRDQMYWRRYTIANKCNKSVETFMQEYPATAEEAFISSGRPAFPASVMLEIKDRCVPPIVRYECQVSTGQWMVNPLGRLKVFEEPKPGVPYIVSQDVAEGLEKGDFNCMDVINHLTGAQVAQWHGKIEPTKAADVMVALGRRYNNALLIPERNNHGYMVVTRIVEELNYSNVYSEMVPEPPAKKRKRYGWVTNSSTRDMIIDNMLALVIEGTHGIKCLETVAEMMTFKVQLNGRSEADEGMFDDRVMSICIAHWARRERPRRVQSTESVKRIKRGATIKKKHITKAGWTP